MEKLMHFSHGHLLSLVRLQPNHDNESSDEEEKHEDEDNFVTEDHHVGQCNMCKEHIYTFHLCYYDCNICDYSLHKFCAEMPTTLQNHPSHPNHYLTLAEVKQVTEPDYKRNTDWKCGVCYLKWTKIFHYHCRICQFNMDIICATMSQQKMDHPSHPHQLQRMSKQLVARCSACDNNHEGTFYHCITCSWFLIHLECALMPSKLLIQQPTNGNVTHSHPLTLAYYFPHIDKKAKFYPTCRVCGKGFYIYFWFYKCDKCRFYVHIGCATSNYIHLLRPGRGKTSKNFKDDDHPNLINCPFPDESYNLLKHQFFNRDFRVNENHGEMLKHFSHQHPLIPDESYNLLKHQFFNQDFRVNENHGEILKHFSHQHPLILLDMQTSLGNKSISLHNPMKKIQLLCDGCVKPITTLPFYKCSQDTPHCGFVLHEWCARLPLEVQNHLGHQKHTLFIMSNVHKYFFGVFYCAICELPSNGFAYGCTMCHYYIDINCAYLPKEITHEAHPSHLLSRTNAHSLSEKKFCIACRYYITYGIAYHCPSCDFYLDSTCALLLPGMIRHKYDKHPLSLKYNPVENHPGDYFCVICEDEMNPKDWFYHCTLCAESMHPTCAPLISCEQAAYAKNKRLVYKFVNIKFGGMFEIRGHPHLLAFVQGIKHHGQCKECHEELQYEMIFKCLKCEHAVHFKCAFPLSS